VSKHYTAFCGRSTSRPTSRVPSRTATEANVTQRQAESLLIAPEKQPPAVEGGVCANRKI